MISWNRVWLLILIYIKASLRRVRYDFARELVVGICTLVLLFLFFYIFNDFINVKVGELSLELKQKFAVGFSYAIIGIVALGSGAMLRKIRHNPAELAQVSLRLGEFPGTKNIYQIVQSILILGLSFGLAWLLIYRYFLPELEPEAWVKIQTIALIVSISIYLWPGSSSPNEAHHSRSRLSIRLTGSSSQSKRWTLVRWRLGQLLLRNRTTRITLAASCILHGLISLSAWVALPFFIAALIAIFLGLLVTAALSTQLEGDMRQAWLEKSFGISHDDIVTCYRSLGAILGVIQGLLALLFYSFAATSLPDAESLKLIPLTALCPLLLSGLMFQIDARRPAISLITCFLIGLFLGTAIIAHWLGFFLLPIALYYSSQYQSNQYYQYQ